MVPERILKIQNRIFSSISKPSTMKNPLPHHHPTKKTKNHKRKIIKHKNKNHKTPLKKKP